MALCPINPYLRSVMMACNFTCPIFFQEEIASLLPSKSSVAVVTQIEALSAEDKSYPALGPSSSTESEEIEMSSSRATCSTASLTTAERLEARKKRKAETASSADTETAISLPPKAPEIKKSAALKKDSGVKMTDLPKTMMSPDMDPVKCLHSLAPLKVVCFSGRPHPQPSYSELFGEIVAAQWQGLQVSFAAFDKFKDLPDQLSTCNMNL